MTKDELEQKERRFSKLFQDYEKAKTAILEHAGLTLAEVQTRGRKRKYIENRVGFLPCPVCTTGKLHYRIHPNGHVWARCETDSCIHFVE